MEPIDGIGKPTRLTEEELINQTRLGEENISQEAIDEELYFQQMVEDSEIQQFLVRRRIQDSEMITGFYRCHFRPGQQREVIHIPFVPALNLIPVIEINLIDHEGCRYRIGELQKFGVRVEIALPRPTDQPLSIALSFQITN